MVVDAKRGETGREVRQSGGLGDLDTGQHYEASQIVQFKRDAAPRKLRLDDRRQPTEHVERVIARHHHAGVRKAFHEYMSRGQVHTEVADVLDRAVGISDE